MTAKRDAPEITWPTRGKIIALGMVIALVLNLLPLDARILPIRPDFVALLILYWCIEQPRRFGIGSAWSIGLLMDVAYGSLFGQHALAYSAMAFVAVSLHRRLQSFSRWQQALHVVVLLLLAQALILAVNLLTGAPTVGLSYFLPAFSGALLWPALPSLFNALRRRTPTADSA